MDQKRSSSSAGTDVNVVCIVCCASIYFDFLNFYEAFLVYGDTGHDIVVLTISQCARTAGCQYKY